MLIRPLTLPPPPMRYAIIRCCIRALCAAFRVQNTFDGVLDTVESVFSTGEGVLGAVDGVLDTVEDVLGTRPGPLRILHVGITVFKEREREREREIERRRESERDK